MPSFPASSSRIAGERRRVTVLFADLAGFTALAERLDPEEALVLVNTCFDALSPIIERYGGAVDKFIGDEIMALFGAPEAHEDDVERALRAALDMQQALAELDIQLSAGLGLHIGINTGLAVAGGIGSRGRQSYSVIGDPVNVAARILNASQAGEILVGADTYRQAAQKFDFETLEPVTLKGKTEPVLVYRLLGVSRRPATPRGLPGFTSPLVGRDTEMQQLLRLGERLRQGQGGVALILGEAGTGKSRLINDWRSALTGSQPGALRWSGAHSPSYGRDSAYQLVVGLLRALLNVGEQGEQSLEVLLADCCGEVADLGAPYLAHLLASGKPTPAVEGLNLQALEPQALKLRYAQAMQELLRGISTAAPLVLVLEDFHWADYSSVELLIRLLPLVDQAPVLICLAARPEPESPSWRLVAALEPYFSGGQGVRLNLSSLAEAESRRLVANLLSLPDESEQPLPGSLYQLVLAKADGNPFFIEEFIRMLFDGGALIAGENGWAIRQELDSLHIPDSLQGLLMGRVDRLWEALRVVLRLAAVIGRRFELPVLEEVLAEEGWQWPGGLPDALQELEQRGLVRPAQAAGVYVFQHTLLQEAAYQALLNQDRRRLHLLVGRSLEQHLGEQKEAGAEQLALHFEHAGEESKALQYYRLAGQSAYRRYGLAEAIRHFQRAIALARRPELKCTAEDLQALALDGGRCLELSSRYPEALSLYQEMEALAREWQSPAFELAMLVEQAKLYSTPTPLNQYALGLAIGERALALAKDLGAEPAEARLEWIMLLLGWISNDHDFAALHARRSLEIARRLNLREQLAYTLQDAHRVFDSQEARACLLEAQQLWRELGNQAMLADNLCSLADHYYYRQEFAEVLPLAMEAYQISRASENLWNQAFASMLIGEVEGERGNISAGIAALQESLQISVQAGVFIIYNRVLGMLFYLYQGLEAVEQSERLLVEAERLITGRIDEAAPFFNITYRHLLDHFRCWIELFRPGDRTEQARRAGAMFEDLWQVMVARYGIELINSSIGFRFRRTRLLLLQANGADAEALEGIENMLAELPEYTYQRAGMALAHIHAPVLARLGRVAEARQVIQSALARLNPEFGRLSRLRFLRVLIEIETLAGDNQAVRNWQTEAGLLVGQIARKIDDPALRQVFLSNAVRWGLLPDQGIEKP